MRTHSTASPVARSIASSAQSRVVLLQRAIERKSLKSEVVAREPDHRVAVRFHLLTNAAPGGRRQPLAATRRRVRRKERLARALVKPEAPSPRSVDRERPTRRRQAVLQRSSSPPQVSPPLRSRSETRASASASRACGSTPLESCGLDGGASGRRSLAAALCQREPTSPGTSVPTRHAIAMSRQGSEWGKERGHPTRPDEAASVSGAVPVHAVLCNRWREANGTNRDIPRKPRRSDHAKVATRRRCDERGRFILPARTCVSRGGCESRDDRSAIERAPARRLRTVRGCRPRPGERLLARAYRSRCGADRRGASPDGHPLRRPPAGSHSAPGRSVRSTRISLRSELTLVGPGAPSRHRRPNSASRHLLCGRGMPVSSFKENRDDNGTIGAAGYRKRRAGVGASGSSRSLI